MPLSLNRMPNAGKPLTTVDRDCVGPDAPAQVRSFLTLRGGVAETPLLELPDVAAQVGVQSVCLKNEALRMNSGSFKSLGGAYAVMVMFKRLLEAELGEEVSIAQLVSPTARLFAQSVTVCCATDGNHGKSVAAGARLLGCRSVVFVHAGVTEPRAQAIGADEIVRVDGSYDESVEEAMRVSQEHGWLLVSDTSWPGYEEIPAFVAQGYTILAEEALDQMQGMSVSPPTHVFLQAGVGGFASSIAGYLSTRLGDKAPTVIIVEPDRAACLYASAIAGEVTSIVPEKATIMAMLECHTPSLIAWRILERTAHAFMTVTDDDARDAMRQLAFRQPGLPGIVAGESGAAGLAGLIVLSKDEELRAAVGLDASSRVLLINTETATDPSSYEEIVGTAPSTIGRAA